MKKFFAFCGSMAAVLLGGPITLFAAESGTAADTSTIPIWLCIPFAGLLLCIAVLPLIKSEWWEKHQPLAVVVWSLLFIIPYAVMYGAGDAAETVLECVLNDYLTFIVLLFGLFCVAGNLTLEGDLAGSPRVNVLFLAIGTLLSSCIGTTGASMLMVRPVIKMNSWRKRKSHIMVFFIFLISNMGGCLTPIGDPPLLMGFMRGVPFSWSLKLLPVLLFNMVILLTAFYLLDRHNYRKDIAEGRKPDITRPGTTLKNRRTAQYHLPGDDRGGRYFKRNSARTFRIPGRRRQCARHPRIPGGNVKLSFHYRNCHYTGSRIFVLPHHETGNPYKEPFHLGRHQGGCRTVRRYFYYNAARTDAAAIHGAKAWTYRTLPDVLGDGSAFQLP